MAEQIVGPGWSSYNQTVEHILQIDEMIYILSPDDLPLMMGTGDEGFPVLPSRPVRNRTFYWQEEEVPLPRTVTNASIIDGVVTSVVVADDQAVSFAVGDHILIEDELLKVTAVNAATHTLTVERGAAGTAAAAHTTVGTEVLGIGTVLPEGDIGAGNFRGRDKPFNYTQIFSGQVKATRTEQGIPKYGVPNELVKQTRNRMHHLMQGIEQAAVYGVAYNDTASETRATGGLKSFITDATTIDSANTWMTLKRIEALQQAVYDNGGNPDGMVLISNPKNFEALNNLADSGRIREHNLESARRGRSKARVLTTEFGDVTLHRHRWLRKEDAFLYPREEFQKRDFQPLVMQPLAKTDDTDKFMMVAECGFQVRGGDHCARFSALDATDTLPSTGLV